MAQDNAGTTASATATNAPETPKIPDGQVLVSKEELQALQRNAARVSGMQPLVEAAIKRGIKTPDDFARFDKQDDTDDEPPARKPKDTLTPDRVATIAQETVTKTFALEQHRQEASQADSLIESIAEQLASKTATASERNILKLAVKAKFAEVGQSDESLYPEGHPLRETHFKPIDKARANKILSDMKAVLEQSAAEAKEAKARSAQAAVLPAGRSGGQGAAATQQAAKPTMKSLRQQALESLSRIQETRAGNPI